MAQMAMKALERLTAAKAAKEVTIRKIAATEDLRRDHLRRGDDAAAAAADHVLIELRLALRRREDEILLLGPLVQREEQEVRTPTDPATMRKLLAQKERRYRELSAQRWNQRNAATQTEFDSLPVEIGRLRQHLDMLERMAS
jgi:hypothetical protein